MSAAAKKPKAKKPGSKKGKGSRKGSAKKTKKLPPDEFDSLTLEELQARIPQLTASRDEFMKQRNYYSLQRDQLQQTYDVTHQERLKTEAHVRNIEGRMEEAQNRHREDIKVYLQKVIHLEYEQQNQIDAVNAAADKQRASELEASDRKRAALKAAKQQLKVEIVQQEKAAEEEIKALQDVQRKELSKLREAFERGLREQERKMQERLQQLIDDQELRRKVEIHEIEERKNAHINDLIRNHERAYAEMKAYYNSITQDNLALIKTLNDDIEELKRSRVESERQMEAIERENEQLSTPLLQAEAKVQELKQTLSNYEKDKESLKHSKARLLVLEDQYKTMLTEHEALEEKYRKVETEREHLYRSFEQTVGDMEARSASKNQFLEKMLEQFRDVFDVKKTQFTAVLQRANLDPVMLEQVTRRLDDVLSEKNRQLEHLNYEEARVNKAHDDLARVCDARLLKLGIPKEQLGFVQPLGKAHTAPANLL